MYNVTIYSSSGFLHGYEVCFAYRRSWTDDIFHGARGRYLQPITVMLPSRDPGIPVQQLKGIESAL